MMRTISRSNRTAENGKRKPLSTFGTRSAPLAPLQHDSGAKQRELARAVGMSLGMTNALLKRLAAKGFITMKKANSRKIQYVITPEGMQEAARRLILCS